MVENTLCVAIVSPTKTKSAEEPFWLKGFSIGFEPQGDHLEKPKTYLEQSMFEIEDLKEHFKISH